MAATWVIEHEVFPDGDEALASAVVEAGGRVVAWDDDWWASGRWPRLSGSAVVFHGSLGNADRVVRELPWTPGAFCSTDSFACSAWWPSAADQLVAPRHVLTTVADLVRLGPPADFGERVFVRPDGALKPFSGRVLARSDLTLASLDHGFYYDDDHLPVVVTPEVMIEAEWRFVVADGGVVAGSGYVPAGRVASSALSPTHPAWLYAAEVCRRFRPDPIFVLDVAQTARGLRVVELNPFSGADLYSCDRSAVVRSAEGLAR